MICGVVWVVVGCRVYVGLFVCLVLIMVVVDVGGVWGIYCCFSLFSVDDGCWWFCLLIVLS